MPIFETYSKRKKGLPDIYTYDNIPVKLKNQACHIWNRFFNQHGIPVEHEKFVRNEIYRTILEEEGEKKLHYNEHYIDNDPKRQVENYFDNLQDTDKTLDVFEITFHFISRLYKVLIDLNPYLKINYSDDKAIEDLNYRFRENGIGYQLENGKIIRTDSTYAHSEIAKPTLALLLNTKFLGANEEYLKAHEHYRHGRNKECLTECLKAFESTIKIICTEKGWTFNSTDTANKLIKICFENNFSTYFYLKSIFITSKFTCKWNTNYT